MDTKNISLSPNLKELDRWNWMMNYCRDNGLSPSSTESWNKAKVMYLFYLTLGI